MVVSFYRSSWHHRHRGFLQQLFSGLHFPHLHITHRSIYLSNIPSPPFSASTPEFSSTADISSGFRFPTFSSLFSTSNSPFTEDDRKNHGRFLSVSCFVNFDSTSKPASMFRGFSRVSFDTSDSEFESGVEFGEIVDDDDRSKQHPIARPGSNMDDVLRVSRVIEELFSQDRSMEAVLDNCGINLNHDLVVDVLDRFCRARKPAIRFFTWAGRRPGYTHDSRTYNKMIDILGKTRQFETMTVFLEEMGKKGLLTTDSFTTAIRYFSAAREKTRAVGCLDLMKRYKFKAGVDFMNYLLHNLCRAKLGKDALAIFEKLKVKCSPDSKTYSILLSGWFLLRNLAEAVALWNRMADEGLKPDIVTHNIMLDGLLKCGRGCNAYELVKVMKAKGPPLNVQSYTIFIRHLCKNGKMGKAVKLFDRMVSSGCRPDRAVYTCLITGFGNMKRMDKVCWVLKEMKDDGCPPDGRTYNALIKLMANRRMPNDVTTVYKEMVGNGFQPTLHTFNMMMKLFFRTGDCEMGCSFWEEMRLKGCCPDDNAYTVFIGGLIGHGKAEEACRYLMEMIDKGMRLPAVDFVKLAHHLSRLGKPSLQEDMAEMMVMHGDIEVSKLFSSVGSDEKYKRAYLR